MAIKDTVLDIITDGGHAFSWDEEMADRIADSVVGELDQSNTIVWKSLDKTPDKFKHCGLGIPIEKWQSLRGI